MTVRNGSKVSRILAAITSHPMTIQQVAASLAYSSNYTRLAMYRMAWRGEVKRAGFADHSVSGNTPYLWVAS